MLRLTQLDGFAALAPAPDATPDPLSIPGIAASGINPSVQTQAVAITGINVPLELRLNLSVPMTPERTVTILRDGQPAVTGASGTFVDLGAVNGTLLQASFQNAAPASQWDGTAQLQNLSDAGAVLATFSFSLRNTATGGGGGGGGGGALP